MKIDTLSDVSLSPCSPTTNSTNSPRSPSPLSAIQQDEDKERVKKAAIPIWKLGHWKTPCREIHDTSEECEYHSRRFTTKKTVKWGQRKLVLSEIQFLTQFWNPDAIPNPVVIYVGAAPGTHIPFLSCLFSNITFHLYDPRPFRILPSSTLFIHNELFTDTQKFYWSQYQIRHGNVFLISDIRTGDLKVDLDTRVYEDKIWNDMLLQQDWVRAIKPVQSLLKFRLPYGVGRRGKGQDTVTYLDGRVFTQAWAGSTSSETRLVPMRDNFGDFKEKKWNIFKYENQMFKHNTVDREYQAFVNPLTGNCGPISPPELLSDHDSICECLILGEYIIYKTGKYDRIHLLYNVPTLSKLLTSNLSKITRLSDLRELKWGMMNNEARIYSFDTHQKRIMKKQKKSSAI